MPGIVPERSLTIEAPDVEEHVEKIKPFIEAGFTEVALVQIGADQQDGFMAWAERELLPALRSL